MLNNFKRIGELIIETFPTSHNPQIILTGFEDFDKKFDGFKKGELILLGGRPAMGKKLFLISLSNNIGRQQIPVAFFSIEIGKYQILNRFITDLSKVRISEKDENKLNTVAINELRHSPIFINDEYRSCISDIVNNIRNLVIELNTEIICIDYLQLINVINQPVTFRHNQIALILKELKIIAIELNITIIVASQLSRKAEERVGYDKRPKLGDLYESGLNNIAENFVDKIVFLFKPSYYKIEFDENNQSTKNIMEVIVAKNNSGSTGIIELKMDPFMNGFIKK
jgi:replicative DNA helicase